MKESAVYQKDGDLWLPTPEARGPFAGQHGGAVSGLLASCMEEAALAADAGTALQCSILLLRPCPLEPCSVRVGTVRAGGRVTVLSATLAVAGKDCALAHAIFIRPETVGSWGALEQPHISPEHFHPVAKPARFTSTAWYRDCVDIRKGDGMFWLRTLRPVTADMSTLARVCALADWASGLSRHDTYESPVVGGFPNAGLTIQLGRSPQGEWIGLKPQSDWYDNGMGMTDTELRDMRGQLGRACHTLVLVPRENR
jgi:hypothetical protein